MPLRLQWDDLARDIGNIVTSLTQTFSVQQLAGARLQVANELFYRNKAAWLVGKLILPEETLPFFLPLHQTEQGALFVDTCLISKA